MTNPENSSTSYKLLDCGFGRKLESLGVLKVERQAAVAFWPSEKPDSFWKDVDATHVRSEKGGGHWKFKNKNTQAKEWWLDVGGLRLKTKLTDFGHCGFFSEQIREWTWLRESLEKYSLDERNKFHFLNLFAYTGGSTVTLAKMGAKVTHVDAAGGIVDWARENAAENLNQSHHPSPRFIIEDCKKFLEREIRRGTVYDGVILDPPTYGRGAKKEVFQIEKDIGPLLETLARVLSPSPKLVHFSSHTPGFSPRVLKQLLCAYVPQITDSSHQFFETEMTIQIENSERVLPSGQCVRVLERR
jgi:23S rRNA (cytosine1962-C5)-methyltransferase